MALSERQRASVNRTSERVLKATAASVEKLNALLDKIPFDSPEHTILQNAASELRTAVSNLEIAVNRTRQWQEEN